MILASAQRSGTFFKVSCTIMLHYTERLHQSATTLKQLTGKVDHIDPLVTIPWVLAVIWTPLDTQHHYTKADLECDENSRCQVNPGPTEGPPWTGPDSDTSRH